MLSRLSETLYDDTDRIGRANELSSETAKQEETVEVNAEFDLEE